MTTPFSDLADLLCKMFGTAELHAFLRRLPGGAALVKSLPEGHGIALLSVDAVALLERRGLLNAAFFQALHTHAPDDQDVISAVAQAWTNRPRGTTFESPESPGGKGAPGAPAHEPEAPPKLLVLRRDHEGPGRGAYVRGSTRLKLEEADFIWLVRLAELRSQLLPYKQFPSTQYAYNVKTAILRALRSVPEPAKHDAARIIAAFEREQARGYRLKLSENEVAIVGTDPPA